LEEVEIGRGDDLIATGLARGAAERGKLIAFGDGERIKWGPFSEMIFRNNPNIAPPGSERKKNLEWIGYYKGQRLYNSGGPGHWIWNYDFVLTPGEVYLAEDEEWHLYPDDLILIEPNGPPKPCRLNKQWPIERFAEVAKVLSEKYTVRQFGYGAPNIVCEEIKTKDFRRAMALLKRARLAILPEGGLHHAAAAVGTPAVVLFGGFAPPAVLGYSVHSNLAGSDHFCGSYTTCRHCLDAMQSISIEQVITAAKRMIACR
jgi:hypothetical protein